MSSAGSPWAPMDTPRSAYRVLERRATLMAVGILLGLAGIAWWKTVAESHDMSMMIQGLASIGMAMPLQMSVVVFLGMWTTMMVAMMFPTIAPIVLLHRLVVRRRGEGVMPTVAFVGGYLSVWALVGAVPLALLIGFQHLSGDSPWVLRLAGGILLVAGAYQFTRWKEACMRACRSPLSFLSTHDFGSGAEGAFRVGFSHGLYCLGCCWALMGVLFVVGLMNLAWMAVITVIFVAEKNLRIGVSLTKVVGVGVVLLGVAVLVHPSLLVSVS